MRKKALQVRLDVREPSVVELTVGETVQLDRLTPSHHGYVAERHGGLLERGVATLALEPGFYFFKTLAPANLKVVRGGVVASTPASGKDPWPQPPPVTPVEAGKVPWPQPPPVKPVEAGDDTPGEAPGFTVVHCTTASVGPHRSEASQARRPG